jgi:hypothetical protein
MERRVLSPATPWSTGFTPTSKTPGSCATYLAQHGFGDTIMQGSQAPRTLQALHMTHTMGIVHNMCAPSFPSQRQAAMSVGTGTGPLCVARERHATAISASLRTTSRSCVQQAVSRLAKLLAKRLMRNLPAA